MTSTNWWHPLVNKEQGPSEERFNKGCLIDPFGEKLAGERFWRNSCMKRLFDWSIWRETSWWKLLWKSYSKFVTKLSRSDRLSKIGNLCTTNLEQKRTFGEWQWNLDSLCCYQKKIWQKTLRYPGKIWRICADDKPAGKSVRSQKEAEMVFGL